MAVLKSPESEISKSEQSQIKEYILKHHTAMLTVMFTDIENYTVMTEQKGDAYSAQLRGYHDDIMRKIIEGDDAGLIVKFIGDAVMAVFSEPTVAVEKAMEIQTAIREFNEKQSEFDDIAVRIGLHVGQIAIEDDVQMDIFGRHVNRAARVESLAAGGQVLVTYPVWDSAKGWLDREQDVQCQPHGAYELKGIDEPIDIYEVYQPEFTQPSAPTKGKIKTSKRGQNAILAGVFAALLVLIALVWPRQPDLWLNISTTETVLINGEVAEFGELDSEGFKPLVTELEPGNYAVTYQISSQLAYVADIDVTGDDQRIAPSFTEVRLPSLKLRSDADTGGESNARAFTLSSLTGEEQAGDWQISVVSELGDSEATHLVEWQVGIEGEETLSGRATFVANTKAGIERFEDQVLFSQNGFDLVLTGFTSRSLIDLTLKWVFSETEF